MFWAEFSQPFYNPERHLLDKILDPTWNYLKTYQYVIDIIKI